MTKRDPKTGRFINILDIQPYKYVQLNGKRMGEHQRNFCLCLNIPKIPKNFVVHHIDGNKKNNDINNLAIVTITAHNRIHKHTSWNKGLKSDDVLWGKTLEKALKTRKENYYKRILEFLNFYNKNKGYKSQIEMAKELKISYSNFRAKLSSYKILYEKEKFNQILPD